MPNDQPSYSAARKMRGMTVGGAQKPESPEGFASHVPKDYHSPDVEDRRRENTPADKAAGTLNYR